MSDARIDGPELRTSAKFAWVGEIPALGAARCGERVALHFVERNEVLTYAELDGNSRVFADLIQARGMREDDRVAYLGRNSDLFYPVLFGSITAQCVLVPLNWRLALPEIRYQLQHAGVCFVICDAEFEPTLRQIANDLDAAFEYMLTEDDAGRTGLRSALRSLAPQPRDEPIDPDRTILLLYTSGTTGNPKGVQLTHRALSLSRHAEL